MEKFKYKNTFLIIYLIAIIIMFTFLVPFNVSINYVSSGVPHSFTVGTEFNSIFFSYHEKITGSSGNYAISSIDYKRLFLQIFCLTIILAILYLLINNKEMREQSSDK